MDTAIKIQELTKQYGDKTAVDHIDLEIMQGELFALLGANGAGKTTTIRMLSCLSTPTEGSAAVLGHDVTKEADEVKSVIGISTQDTAVAENLTVEENLRFMTEIHLGEKATKESIAEKTKNMIELFQLEEVKNKKAKTLSGGWQRKLSIAMAIITEPKVLYLDEPTLGLDVLSRRQLWKEIMKLKNQMTIILTTHYMEEAEALADRIAIMIDGKINALGTLSELEEQTGKKGMEEVFVQIAMEGGVL